jgi:hypothetical protein
VRTRVDRECGRVQLCGRGDLVDGVRSGDVVDSTEDSPAAGVVGPPSGVDLNAALREVPRPGHHGGEASDRGPTGKAEAGDRRLHARRLPVEPEHDVEAAGHAVGYFETCQVGVGELHGVHAIGCRAVQKPGDQVPTPLGSGAVVCDGSLGRDGFVGPRVADPEFVVDSGQERHEGVAVPFQEVCAELFERGVRRQVRHRRGQDCDGIVGRCDDRGGHLPGGIEFQVDVDVVLQLLDLLDFLAC